MNDTRVSMRRGLLALSPVMVFIALYLVVSIFVGDFYKMPISVAMIVASVWALILFKGHPLLERIDTLLPRGCPGWHYVYGVGICFGGCLFVTCQVDRLY